MGMGKDKVKWPPWFPEITYLNFYLQGHVEPKLCAVRASNVKCRQKQTTSLRHKITPFTWTDKHLCICAGMNGGHSEHSVTAVYKVQYRLWVKTAGLAICTTPWENNAHPSIFKRINRISSWHEVKAVWWLCSFSHTFSKVELLWTYFITLWQNLRILQFLHFV
jgi:hypothetical protein